MQSTRNRIQTIGNRADANLRGANPLFVRRGSPVRAIVLGLTLMFMAYSTANQLVWAQSCDAIEPLQPTPAVRPDHAHARALLDNALLYLAPESGTVDRASGYPVEGWNNEPKQGLALRSFTQLTAIGKWMEVLANIAAGSVHTGHISPEKALADLQRIVQSLRYDQRDPNVSAKGLLGNFLDLAGDRRSGPLTSTVDRRRFADVFGAERGEAIWQALQAKGWIRPDSAGREAAVLRESSYGATYFDGALAPYADEATKTKIMEILDQRAVTVVFGDNANLSSSVARTIGALLAPPVREHPVADQLRMEMEQFLSDQQEGYAYLYNAQTGLFYFGWEAARNRMMGWQDSEGIWRPGHMDYLVNEFRGPASFVVVRYGIPADAVANLGFKMKPYGAQGAEETYVLAPWEGSAFQALGLGLSAGEWCSPSWRTLLEQVVNVNLDYSRRQQLPGFLSESYIGEGARYTGDVGIPDIAVNTMPRITHVASLYTLGVAYALAPAKVERFLADNWPKISTLLTDHGPWEGFNMATQEPVRIQTTAHTLALILGMLGTGPEHMIRYLDSKELRPRMRELYRPGEEEVDLLSEEQQVFAWGNEGSMVASTRQRGVFQVKGDRARRIGIAFVSPGEQGMNLSGGHLSIRYRSAEPIGTAVISLKSAANRVPGLPLISKEIFVQLSQTEGREEEIRVLLPATPGLADIKEVVIEYEPEKQDGAADMSIRRLAFTPYGV